jgi:hypothetical protein
MSWHAWGKRLAGSDALRASRCSCRSDGSPSFVVSEKASEGGGGSGRVDIKLWNVRRAQLHCLTCGHEAWIEGFTVSEFDPAKLLTAAVRDQARKHRRRPPDEARRIEEHRKARTR